MSRHSHCSLYVMSTSGMPDTTPRLTEQSPDLGTDLKERFWREWPFTLTTVSRVRIDCYHEIAIVDEGSVATGQPFRAEPPL